MRRIGFSMVLAMAIILVYTVTPVIAQAQTAPAQTNFLSGFLKKQKPAPLHSQTVSKPRAASDAALKKAAEANRQASEAMMAAQRADTAKRIQGLEAMFAAERAKAEAEAAQQRSALAMAPKTPTSGAVSSQGTQPSAPPVNPVRVYTKKNTAGDQPRRLFNVREQ